MLCAKVFPKNDFQIIIDVNVKRLSIMTEEILIASQIFLSLVSYEYQIFKIFF